MGGCVNILGSCVSFQIKFQILAFYTDVCTAPKYVYYVSVLFCRFFAPILFSHQLQTYMAMQY